MKLLNSKITIRYSTKFFDSPIKDDSLIPDEIIEITSDDLIKGIDPVLEKVLEDINNPDV